jgi:SET domain-containing protein 6
MFWTDEQIQELKGTDIVDKIGRQSAEDTYNQKIKPVLQVREMKRRTPLDDPSHVGVL